MTWFLLALAFPTLAQDDAPPDEPPPDEEKPHTVIPGIDPYLEYHKRIETAQNLSQIGRAHV